MEHRTDHGVYTVFEIPSALPIGIERKPSGQVWMTHCYGTLGVGRENWPDTGSGAELYVVIGQAPRQLDRNIVVAGRVLRGIEWLSALPRATGAQGFYDKPEQRTPHRSVAHRHPAVHQIRRITPQPPRRVVHRAGRTHRRLQPGNSCARLRSVAGSA